MDSLETAAIVSYVKASGVPHIRSSYYCQGHSSSGYHCLPGTGAVGTACDFQDPYPRDQAGLLAIFDAFLKVETQLAEAIYSGASFNIKDGRRVPRYAISAHYNHVHVAVKRGVYVHWPYTPPPPPPPLPPIVVAPFPGEQMTRQDLLIATDGAGNGWGWLEVDALKVQSIVVNGPYPPADGYWNLPTVARQARDGRTVVTVTETAPGVNVLVSVWVAD